jgi:hypothetical protein
LKRPSYFSQLVHDVRGARSLLPSRLLFHPPLPGDEQALVQGNVHDFPDRNRGELCVRARWEEARPRDTSSAEMGTRTRRTASTIAAPTPQFLESPTPGPGFNRESSAGAGRPERIQPEGSHPLNVPAVFEAHPSPETARNIAAPTDAQAEDRASPLKSSFETVARRTRPVDGHSMSSVAENDPTVNISRPVPTRVRPAATATEDTQPGAALTLEPPPPVREPAAAIHPSGTHSKSNDQSRPTVTIGSLQVHIGAPPAGPTAQSPRIRSDRAASRAAALSRGFGTFGLTQG